MGIDTFLPLLILLLWPPSHFALDLVGRSGSKCLFFRPAKILESYQNRHLQYLFLKIKKKLKKSQKRRVLDSFTFSITLSPGSHLGFSFGALTDSLIWGKTAIISLKIRHQKKKSWWSPKRKGQPTFFGIWLLHRDHPIFKKK